jgi:hypothetical protein
VTAGNELSEGELRLLAAGEGAGVLERDVASETERAEDAALFGLSGERAVERTERAVRMGVTASAASRSTRLSRVLACRARLALEWRIRSARVESRPISAC